MIALAFTTKLLDVDQGEYAETQRVNGGGNWPGGREFRKPFFVHFQNLSVCSQLFRFQPISQKALLSGVCSGLLRFSAFSTAMTLEMTLDPNIFTDSPHDLSAKHPYEH